MKTGHQPRANPLGAWRMGLCLGLVCGLAPFRALSLEPVTARSQSGQFVVRGLPFGEPFAAYSTSAVRILRLDPTLTAVSLERIRHVLVTELGVIQPQRSPVKVNTHPLQDGEARVRLASIRFNDGWAYQVDLPDLIDRQLFVRTAVRVVLQELANRKDTTEEAPLPSWLVEGLAAQLQASSPGTLALEMDRPDAPGTLYQGRVDPLQSARTLLRQRTALTFDQLCLPTEDELSGDGGALYRACAQVFVHDLLRLRDGRTCLREMLRRLPENLNWQTTFLQAFRSHFPRLVDADKWYSVNVATFSGRELSSLWPVATTLAQLDDVLSTTVLVRASTNDLPVNAAVNLQHILGDWEFSRQQPVLRQKVQQLQGLRLRGASEVTGLIDGYLAALGNYLVNSTQVRAASPAAKSQSAGLPKSAAATVIRQLNALDAQRETLRLRVSKAARAP